MKKRLLAAAVLAALTVSTATAFAAPTFSGDARTLIQTEKDQNTYSDIRFRLNVDAELGEGMYAHGRIMGIDNNMGAGLNFAEAGTGTSGASVNMEQMYLGAKIGDFDFKAGRQPVLVGNGLLADINGVTGIGVATAAGDVNMNAFTGRSADNNVTAANIGTKVENVNLAAGYLKKDADKYWAVNAGTKIDNVALTGEYVKNNTADKTGFLVKATVGEAVKKGDFNYALSYRNIEAGAVDADWTTNGAFADSKGFRVEANYKFADNVNLAVYQDITKKHSDSTVKPNQARMDLSVSF